MPGLRSKAVTLNSRKREASNFYVWDSEDAAKAFFTDEFLQRVTNLYGVRPDVEFVQIAQRNVSRSGSTVPLDLCARAGWFRRNPGGEANEVRTLS